MRVESFVECSLALLQYLLLFLQALTLLSDTSRLGSEMTNDFIAQVEDNMRRECLVCEVPQKVSLDNLLGDILAECLLLQLRRRSVSTYCYFEDKCF